MFPKLALFLFGMAVGWLLARRFNLRPTWMPVLLVPFFGIAIGPLLLRPGPRLPVLLVVGLIAWWLLSRRRAS